jgi:hypothetical protein
MRLDFALLITRAFEGRSFKEAAEPGLDCSETFGFLTDLPAGTPADAMVRFTLRWGLIVETRGH